jgi:hypothetical protein
MRVRHRLGKMLLRRDIRWTGPGSTWTGLPAKRGELAGAGDRDDAGGLATLAGQDLPALVQTSLGAPGDLDHPCVLAVLAAGKAVANGGLVAVVVGDEEPAGVTGPGLGDWALAALGVGGVLAGDDPQEPRQLFGRKRRQSPTSAHRPAAESVSIPRKQRSAAIVGAWRLSGMTCSSVASSAARRARSISTPAR